LYRRKVNQIKGEKKGEQLVLKNKPLPSKRRLREKSGTNHLPQKGGETPSRESIG